MRRTPTARCSSSTGASRPDPARWAVGFGPMALISRGFHGRHRDAPAGRVPPGQYLVDGFPVLSAGPTPHTPTDRWDFAIVGEVDDGPRWTWERVRRAAVRDGHDRHPLRDEVVEARIRSGTASRSTRCSPMSSPRRTYRDGVLRRRLHDQRAARRPARRQGVGRDRLRRRAARARAWRPRPAARPPPVLCGRAPSGCAACGCTTDDEPGFWESLGYHMYGDPWREQRYAGD